ncbi:hypothetical protein KY290_031082 [Solanum tuberosum]|uniref:Uncharacterized protein n=1 Tax=Solanum tuberosum TaxID=4113 RepID=A0ABQ7UA16_SOLTU|nr:hypothetical protein KY290_031082 [Solanum tuberosum]
MVVSLPICSWFELELGGHLVVGFSPKNADLVLFSPELRVSWWCLWFLSFMGCFWWWFWSEKRWRKKGKGVLVVKLKEDLVLGAAGCLRLKLARWFAAVVVGSSENMEMGSFPVALGRAAGSKQRERGRKLGFLGQGFVLPELRRILGWW